MADDTDIVRRLDLASWPRRPHYEFFRQYAEPFFHLTVPLEVGPLRKRCRESGVSFFLASLYLCLKAANEQESFRYRIRGDEVVVLPTVHVGSTVLRSDETFAFVYLDYSADFEEFVARGEEAMRAAEEGPPRLDVAADRDDLIHHTVLPWMAYSAFEHARPGPAAGPDSVPKTAFGKVVERGSQTQMPVSVSVHHALVDGLDVGRFYERFETLLSHPEEGGIGSA